MCVCVFERERERESTSGSGRAVAGLKGGENCHSHVELCTCPIRVHFHREKGLAAKQTRIKVSLDAHRLHPIETFFDGGSFQRSLLQKCSPTTSMIRSCRKFRGLPLARRVVHLPPGLLPLTRLHEPLHWRAKHDPKATMLYLQSFLRKGVSLGYVGSMLRQSASSLI